MRRLSHPLFVLCSCLGLLVACGPAEQEGASPAGGPTARVEQEIGSTPSCALGERLDSQTTWSATCASCSATAGDGSWPPGAFGRKGTLSQRCCATTSGACGGWKLIGPVCSACDLN